MSAGDSHPDRLRWNARYASGFVPSFTPHPLAVRALAMDLPDGPVADLACGPSGTVLLAAARLAPGEPASLLPAGFAVLDQHDLPDRHGLMRRQLLARRR
jgi:hypothetical protein